MPWIACELHTHTFHSDGRQTLRELAAGAKALGFECIALTDHNTMTGLQDKETIEREAGLAIVSGMEWTTFYGHMVTLGVTTYEDWRPVGPGDIHRGIARVHAGGGIAGMAHPFRIGSPICTGCFWEFDISDWNDIDYIEVWSGTFPSIKTDNARAFRLWTDKLNEGCRIAATSGRDWHSQERTEEPVAVTYLNMDEGAGTVTERAVRALAAGRASLTIGPLVTMEAVCGSGSFVIGDAVPAAELAEGRCTIHVHADFSVRRGLWSFPEQTYTVHVTGNNGVAAEGTVTADRPDCRVEVQAEGLRWLRAELWGTVRGVRALIAVTNAIYFNR
ncbi:histidinol phosphatase [Gordoniibacillus kamchatkensis]|uniref:Histidinol phosphatase n=1 Tax=Gordoniibacillus kamchatkensis TaxID=1590651 RepID=A0ABR5ABY8_9BACL|nr:CehA/McbA family metallohydrolase [Paenibacillus sp. VKM B-2647]KIL38551.1 histidinol phosphatase [Paenibacillus sp. VKM B-2647]